MKIFEVAAVTLLLGCQVYQTLACNNYEIIVKKMEACKGVPSVINFQNVTVILSEDCKIIPKGCVTYKSFTSAMVKLSVTKYPLPVGLNEVFDACEELKSTPGAPRCPVTENQICGDKNKFFDINPYKEYVEFAAGRIVGEVNIKHNSGTSCLKFDFSIEKKGEKKGFFNKIFKKNKKNTN